MPNKRGRPPGSKNKPDALKEWAKENMPLPKVKRMPKPQLVHGTRPYTFEMDAVAHRTLKLHSLRRGVPFTQLLNDIIHSWLALATDYDQAIFRETLPPNTRAPRVPERFVGYIESLGFSQPAPQAPISHQAPMFTPPSAYPRQASPNEPTLTDLMTPYRHPLAHEGPAAYPHPAPTLPHGAGVFDPATPLHTGSGSAAQDVQFGRTPGDDLPPLPEEVEALLKHYKVDPNDIR